ncbi:unnamed protein product [Owenia fusiformis]|uniref:Protein wntless n=1 Tax=Owenia fusiformis TaxID=6347 RepID=A0A8S4MX94_OWEFU|nr:unnamed protein product [Owenia fusiformis]
MGGVILENLSNRKLIGLGVLLGLLLLTFFLVGGLVAPTPSNVSNVLGTICKEKSRTKSAAWYKKTWYTPRGPGKCESANTLDELGPDVHNNQVVFAFMIPLPRDGHNLQMSSWFQHITSVLDINIEYQEGNEIKENAMVSLELKLGGRNKDTEPWTLIAAAEEIRTLDCSIEQSLKTHGQQYNCSVLPLFELGSCHYSFYLLNLRLPTFDYDEITEEHVEGKNTGIGKVVDIWTVFINQNGGFTKVWFSMKTLMFPTVLMVLCWFWRRIMMLERKPNLLEKALLCLGIALTQLNLPIEWFTLWFDFPFMLLLSDIRQGVFYSFLMCFWIIFSGEHMMDQVERSRLVQYWKHLSAVLFGCICLFVFEMCERGVQLTNPFYSIWSTDAGSKLALGFVVLAGIAACTYFIFLCYMIFKVFRNIGAKKNSLPQMSAIRRKYYMGLIYRFKFLMLSTLICAAMTVIFFIISQVSESQWKWGEENSLEYTSAFLCGVYGMWNLYVIALLVLYAPSHKYVSAADEDDSLDEQIEFTQIASESSALASFARKAAAD